LASNTKKREGKVVPSLELLIVIIIIIGVAVPSPRIFHSWRRKRGVDCGLGGLKTHGSVHLTLALL
jgi:hypothetical protein